MGRPVMYIFVNRGLGMSAGKLAAQASHAAVEAYRISALEHVSKWYKGGHYTKLVMLARDTDHLGTIREYIDKRGFKTTMIIDEGITEVDAHVKTALGVEIVDKDDEHTEATFSSFELYRDTVKVRLDIER